MVVWLVGSTGMAGTTGNSGTTGRAATAGTTGTAVVLVVILVLLVAKLCILTQIHKMWCYCSVHDVWPYEQLIMQCHSGIHLILTA